MRFLGPRNLQGELQVLLVAVGSAFLLLATFLLYQNGQAALRRQVGSTAVSAAETAASLIALEDHRQLREPPDMNTDAYRNIVTNLGALRRANPAIFHLFTLAPLGQLGTWGIVVDLGSSGPDDDESIRSGRLPIGSPPPKDVPADLIHRGMNSSAARIFELLRPDQARVIAVAPIRTIAGEAIGLAVVEMSAATLASEARLLAYVSVGIFLLGLALSVMASSLMAKWVTRPIEDLSRGVEEISLGNLEARVGGEARSNELGALARAFNRMAEGLQQSQARSWAQQERLRSLHRLGLEAASNLDVTRMLVVAAGGFQAICGGVEAYAGVADLRGSVVRHWSRSGSDEVAFGGWEAALDPLKLVLRTETRVLSRAEFEAAGLGCLQSRPGPYALVAPLRIGNEMLGVLLALGDLPQFQEDAVSLGSLFAAQVSAAVSHARLFEEVRAVDRSKSEFLSIASHEVRTPLTVIKSSLDVLVHSPQFEYSTDQRQLIGFCQESVERLIRLVKDILDVSKIEAGVFSLHLAPTSLNELIEKCLFWIPKLPGGAGIEIEARIPSRVAVVYADENRITQVLENLISNAIKFSKPGGKVSIEVVEHEREHELIVSDSGKGIAVEDLKRIFGKFYQVEESSTREQGGTGLGLAICQGIVEAHKGRIWAESEGVGQGSKFHVALVRVLDGATSEKTEAQISVSDLISAIRPTSAEPRRA